MTNSLDLTYNSQTYSTPFTVLLYLCADSNCVKCDFDSDNLKTGSQKCTECSVGWLLKSSDWKCQPECGDGKVLGVEVCDDGGLGGCL